MITAIFNPPNSSAQHGRILTEDEQAKHRGLYLPLCVNGKLPLRRPTKEASYHNQTRLAWL
jgi:hypothetical protein